MQILINTLDRNATDGGVIVVHWTVTKTNGDLTASSYGTEGFTPDPTSSTFKPYEQLTKEDVIGWLNDRWGDEGMAAKEAALDTQLNTLKNPPVMSGTPWSM